MTNWQVFVSFSHGVFCSFMGRFCGFFINALIDTTYRLEMRYDLLFILKILVKYKFCQNTRKIFKIHKPYLSMSQKYSILNVFFPCVVAYSGGFRAFRLNTRVKQRMLGWIRGSKTKEHNSDFLYTKPQSHIVHTKPHDRASCDVELLVFCK